MFLRGTIFHAFVPRARQDSAVRKFSGVSSHLVLTHPSASLSDWATSVSTTYLYYLFLNTVPTVASSLFYILTDCFILYCICYI